MLAGDKPNELDDHFMQTHNSDQYGTTELEGENSASKDNTRNMPHTGQLNAHAYTENIDII